MSRFDSLFAAVGLPSVLHHHAREIVHHPFGEAADAVTITAIVDFENEDDTAPVMIDMDEGSVIERYGMLEIPVAVEVISRERPERRSNFVIDGKLWSVKRIVSRDGNLQRVRIHRREKISTRTTRV